MTYDMGDDTSYQTENPSLSSYVYIGDTGTTKTITLRTNVGIISSINTISFTQGTPVEHIDFSKFNNATSFSYKASPLVTGVTHTTSNGIVTSYLANSCNLIGNLDLSMFVDMNGVFLAYSNSNLTGITHTASTIAYSQYKIQNCDITGINDMSMLIGGFGPIFYANSNTNLTEILHAPQSDSVTYFLAPTKEQCQTEIYSLNLK